MCVNLIDVGQSLGEGIAGHLVSVFVSELGGLTTRSVDTGSGIGDRPRHHTPNGRGDLEDVRDGGGINEFVLEKVSLNPGTANASMKA